MNRAVRIDKLTLAALEATLRLYRDETEALEKIPTLKLITLPPKEIFQKAQMLVKEIQGLPCEITIEETISRVGGGALPLASPKSYAVALKCPSLSATKLERRLRQHEPPIIGRIEEERLLLDMRTVLPDEIQTLARALQKICGGEINCQN